MPLSREEYAKVGGYEDVDPSFQHLSLAGRSLEVSGLKVLLTDLADDNIIKHLDLSNNISVKTASIPAEMEEFLKYLTTALANNKHLTALDLAGNNLFTHTAHPCNEHLIDYLTAFTEALLPSEIRRIDLSENCIVGKNGRMYSGLRNLMTKFLLPAGEVLRARKSNLHSYCFRLIAEGVGTGSDLFELDLSDNLAGLDPSGRPSSDGITALCSQLLNTTSLRILRLPRNHILDDDIITIANTLAYLPSCEVLDLSGNLCAYFGARALKFAIMGHGTLSAPKTGLKELYLSQNCLQSEGTLEICEALRATYTLTHIGLAQCEIERETMFLLRDALATNSTIIYMDIADNRVSPYVQASADSEVEAMRVICQLRKEPLKVDATKLNKVAYAATAKKLRFLSKDILRKLHRNPSFNIIPSEMRDNLHVLEPPDRGQMIGTVKSGSEGIHGRLEASRQLDRRMRASRKIFNVVIVWGMELLKERAFEKQMEMLRQKQKLKDAAAGAED